MSDIYYEPKSGITIDKCIELDEFNNFVKAINTDTTLSLEQKRFLKLLATRFIIFKFDKIADYYSITSYNMQKWLERLRTVIVDDDSAINNGYLKFKKQYTNLIESIVNEK